MGIEKWILVVDDDEQILIVWRGALLKYAGGWRLETARDGCEALDLAMQRAFDLIVTDIQMPCMNGSELTEAVRQLNQDVPVIWITGFPGDELEARAARLGVYCCLIKPLAIAEIRQVVAEVLENSRVGGPAQGQGQEETNLG